MRKAVNHFIMPVNLVGYVGMLFIQFATTPTIFRAIFTGDKDFPAWDLVFMVWAGLALYFVRAVMQRDMVYMISNGIGFTFQSVLLILITVN